jgi:hypothetical protein
VHSLKERRVCRRHTVGDGNPLQPGVSPPTTKCCATWSNKPNATNAACVAKNQKKPCADPYYCANPDPETGKYGSECAPWNSSLCEIIRLLFWRAIS